MYYIKMDICNYNGNIPILYYKNIYKKKKNIKRQKSRFFIYKIIMVIK